MLHDNQLIYQCLYTYISIGKPSLGVTDGGYCNSPHVNRMATQLLDLIQSFSRQALHASTIRFPSLNRDDVYEFKADLPQDIKSLIQLM